jgi:hypothetical protein
MPFRRRDGRKHAYDPSLFAEIKAISGVKWWVRIINGHLHM